MWCLIGGSGFEKFENFKTVQTLNRETPFGLASSGFKKVRFENHEILFLPRHGENHEVTPSEINYRANIFALKRHGGNRLLSVSAVGSLRKELAPGDCVIANQYIDRTKGIRAHTFCGQGLVGHVSLAQPTCGESRQVAKMASEKSNDFRTHFDKTYIVIEGPTFSTQAESTSYRMIGADIIGMTNFPEYALAREAGLCYLPLCFVTDYDCWDPNVPHVTLDEVLTVMKQNNQKAYDLAKRVLDLSKLTRTCECSTGSLRTGTMTSDENLPTHVRSWLDTIRA